MKKIIIYLILSSFLLLVLSCTEEPQYHSYNPTLKKKNPFLYNIMYNNMVDEKSSNPIVIPLTTTFIKYPQHPSESIKYIRDSMFVINDINSFYLDLNIHLMDYETFCDKVFEEIVNKQFISVDTNLFKELKKWGYVSEDPCIKQLYEQEGIIQVLNTYLNDRGWLDFFYPTPEGRAADYHGKNVNIEYIIYLASLHNIYFSLYYHHFDEPTGYYLNKYISDTTQLKGLKPLEDDF